MNIPGGGVILGIMRTLLLALAVVSLPATGFAGESRGGKGRPAARPSITQQTGTAAWSPQFKKDLRRGAGPAAKDAKERRADPPPEEPPPYAKPGAFIRSQPVRTEPGTPQTYHTVEAGKISQDEHRSVSLETHKGVFQGPPDKKPSPSPGWGGAASGANAITPGTGDASNCAASGTCNGPSAGSH